MKRIKSRILPLGVVAATASLVYVAYAAEKSYDFKDPKGLNSIVVIVDAPLETANGLANGITGNVSFDPDKPNSVKGKIVVDATSLKFSNATYTDAAHSSRGLDTEKYPRIEFNIKSADDIKKGEGNVYRGNVTGDFTLHGVTKSITIPVSATLQPGGNKGRTGGRGTGDLLTLRSAFKFKRTDYGINPPLPVELLADEVEIRISISGIAS